MFGKNRAKNAPFKAIQETVINNTQYISEQVGITLFTFEEQMIRALIHTNFRSLICVKEQYTFYPCLHWSRMEPSTKLL